MLYYYYVLVGILKIRGIPKYDESSQTAFDGLGDCLLSHNEEKIKRTSTSSTTTTTAADTSGSLIHSTTMNDGSLRLTIATASERGVPGKMTHPCAQPASSLRALVDTGARQLFLALDLATTIVNPSFPTESYVMKPYRTYFELMHSGEHLEHLHTYYNRYTIDSVDSINNMSGFSHRKTITTSANTETTTSAATMKLHTDSGLLIAMTCGHYARSGSGSSATNTDFYSDSTTASSNTRSRRNGLYMERGNGELVHVECASGDLIVMVGAGGEHWLAPKLGGALHAVPHALYVDFDEAMPSTVSQDNNVNTDNSNNMNDKDKDENTDMSSTSTGIISMSRSWYGKMFLPPADAVLQNSNGMTYRNYRDTELATLFSQSESKRKTRGSSGVSAAVGAYLPAACEGGDSTNSNFVLTDSCDPSTTIMCWMQCLSIGNCSAGTAVCTDTITGMPVDGTTTCLSSGGVSACQPWCPNTNEYYKPEPINNFCLGPGVSMSMSGFVSIMNSDPFATECFVVLFPSWVLDGSWKVVFACIGTFSIGILIHYLTKLKTTIIRQHWFDHYSVSVRWSVVVLVYSVQIFLSYIIMLIAMTYNTELFLMVGIGLTIGYALFSSDKTYISNSASGSYFLANTSPEPCCQPDNSELFDDEPLSSTNSNSSSLRATTDSNSLFKPKYNKV